MRDFPDAITLLVDITKLDIARGERGWTACKTCPAARAIKRAFRSAGYRMTVEVFPNGVQRVYAYSPRGNLRSQQSVELSDFVTSVDLDRNPQPRQISLTFDRTL